jgi:ribosomal protein L37AE/L43A
MGTMAVKVHFDPSPQIRVVARSADPKCPDCKGKGTIELLTSVVPCTRCGRTLLAGGITKYEGSAYHKMINDDVASGWRWAKIS